MIVRKLQKRGGAIAISVVQPPMGDDGWTFDPAPGTIPDPLFQSRFLREVYLATVSLRIGV